MLIDRLSQKSVPNMKYKLANSRNVCNMELYWDAYKPELGGDICIQARLWRVPSHSLYFHPIPAHTDLLF